jgi:hypothetical protein
MAPRMMIGKAAEVLVAASAGADLLVVGSRGIAGLESIEAGSVSYYRVACAECPVVIVRHNRLRKRHVFEEELTAHGTVGGAVAPPTVRRITRW